MRIRVVAIILGGCLLAGCGLPRPEEDAGDSDGYWCRFDSTFDARRVWEEGYGGPGTWIPTPQARHTTRDARAPEKDSRTWIRLDIDARLVVDDVEVARGDGWPELRLPIARLHVAADRPWSRVAGLFHAVNAEGSAVERIEIEVGGWGPAGRHFDVSPAAAVAAGPADVTIHLFQINQGEMAFVRLRFEDEYTFDFPTGAAESLRDEAPFAAADRWVAVANHNWRRFETVLPGSARQAYVVIPDDFAEVPFAFVVAVLDLLLGEGVEHVSFPAQDVHLQLHEPAPSAKPATWPVVSRRAILFAVLGVVLALVCVFVPLRRKA